MQRIDLTQLLEQAPGPARPPLDGWYADPLSQAEATALQQHAQRNQHEEVRAGRPAFHSHLALLIAAFWLEQDLTMQYPSLAATARDCHEQALLELVFGQLLMARKRKGAHEHLRRGFALAAHLLPARAYFDVLNAITLLQQLPLTEAGSPAQGLLDLLTEARVIQRLRRPGRSANRDDDHIDTLG